MRRGTSKLFTASVVFGVALLNGGLAACSKSQSSEALIKEAKEYRQKGDNKAAVIQLKNALQKNADNAEARYLLGDIYNQIGDPRSAEKELRKALALGISAEKVAPRLGMALLMLGQYQQVLDETSQVAAATKDHALLTLRGNAYLALGKPTEAKESFDRALKEKADFPDALIGLAKHAALQNDIPAATALAERAVATSPNNPDTWRFKGDLTRAQGKVEPALVAYDQVLKLRPGDAGTHITKATLEIQTKNFDAAKVDIDAARKSIPNGPIVLYTQALLDFTQGKHAAAWESLQQVLRVAPEHMPSLLLAGAVQLALGSTQQAEQHVKKYLEKNPRHPYASKMLAAILLKNGQAERAISIVNAALKDAPEDPQLLALAGESYMQAKEFAKATKYFEAASALAPQVARTHTALAISNLAQGENSRAITELELATSLDGKSPQAGILLVMTHMRLNDFDKALGAVKALEKEQPDNPLVYNLKGGIYVGKKDIPNARASFERALALEPAYFPAASNLAQLDLEEKKPGAAKKRFEAVLERDKKNPQAMAALAGLALSQGNGDVATDWLERANKENPEQVQPALLLAQHYLRSGEKQKALMLMQKLQVANPANPEVLDSVAQAQFANNDQGAAVESYKKLAAVLPTSPIPRLRMASIYIGMQDYAAASEAVKKALSLKPDYLDAQLVQIALEVQAGRYEPAIAIARQVQKQRDKSPAGYFAEGDVLMSQNNPAAAIKLYERAFALSKGGVALMKVHASLQKAGRDKEAHARISQWLKEHPSDIPTRMYLATTSLTKQDNKVAIEQFETILRQDPKNVIALNNLALAFQQDKDPRALEYAEKAHNMAPEHPGILDTLGWIHVEQGDVSRGLTLLQKAVSLAPESSDIRFHLAMGFAKSGETAKARKELEQLLASGKTFPNIDEARALLKTVVGKNQ